MYIWISLLLSLTIWYIEFDTHKLSGEVSMLSCCVLYLRDLCYASAPRHFERVASLLVQEVDLRDYVRISTFARFALGMYLFISNFFLA